MKNRAKIVFLIFYVVVICGCGVFYLAYGRRLYRNICTPQAYSPITGYSAEIVDGIPEGYEYGVPGYKATDGMKVMEITYKLRGVVNEPIEFTGGLCDYYDADGECLDALDRDPAYWAYIDGTVLPPGENVIYREYVLVPEGTESIRAYPSMGENEELLIEL